MEYKVVIGIYTALCLAYLVGILLLIILSV